MPRQVRATIQSKGRKLPIIDFNYVRLHQDVHTHHSFEVSVTFDHIETRTASFVQTAHEDLVGHPITLTMQQWDTGVDYDFTFTGIVTDLVVGSDNDYTGTFVIKGSSPSCLLADGVQKRTFQNKTLADIVKQVLRPYAVNDLPTTLTLASGAPLPYVVQYNESNFDFLNRLLAERHQWFYFDGTQLQIGTPKQDKTVNLFMDGYWSNFQVEVALRPSKVLMYDYDPVQHKKWEGKNPEKADGIATNKFASFANSRTHEVFTQVSYASPGLPAQSQADVEQVAQQAGKARATSYLTFRGVSDNPNLQLGRLVDATAEGLGSANIERDSVGKYRIISITHHIDAAGNYQNNFTAVLHSAPLPPPNPFISVPVPAPELAKVIEVKDPQNMGRVRVRYPWPVAQPVDAESGWLRVTTPYSGAGKGQLFTPEKGSQVLVHYEQHRAERPLVLGNLFHTNNPQKASYTHNGGEVKSIQTIAGNRITFHDKKGEEKIVITNGNKKGTALEISFKGNGQIELKTDGDIALKAGQNVRIEAGKSINLKAGNSIAMQAEEEIQVASKKKSVAVKAKDKVTLDAKTATVTGSSSAQLLSSSTVDVGTGSTVNISASVINQS